MVHFPLGLNTRLLSSVQHLFLNSIKISSDNSIAICFGSEKSEETFELLATVKVLPAAVLCYHISFLSEYRRARAAVVLLWICWITTLLKLPKVGEELSPSLACLSTVNKQPSACLNSGILSFWLLLVVFWTHFWLRRVSVEVSLFLRETTLWGDVLQVPMPNVLTCSPKEKATYGACHLPLFQITPQKINLWSQITVITVSWNISFTCFFIYLFCMWVEKRFGGCTGKQMPQYSPEDQNTTHRSPLSSFSMWVSGIECRSLGCAESIPTIDPSLQLFSMIQNSLYILRNFYYCQ